jgi:L-ascorbate metabolism protein UlaG (beta-lactamase superfamily)
VDVAFVPLDYRLEEHAPRCIASFMEILGAAHVFPMHYWGREAQVREYLKDERIARYAGRISFDSEAEIND